jgi:hypothetical protein
MDWITLTLELIGLIILLLWIVIPIQEFKFILREIHKRDGVRTERSE